MQNRFEQFSQNIIAMHTGSAGAFDPARMMFPPEEKEASSQEMQNLYMTNVYRIQNLTEENYLYRQNFQFLTQMFEKQIHKKLYPQVERQVEKTIRQELPKAEDRVIREMTKELHTLVKESGVEQLRVLEKEAKEEQKVLLRKIENIYNSSVYVNVQAKNIQNDNISINGRVENGQKTGSAKDRNTWLRTQITSVLEQKDQQTVKNLTEEILQKVKTKDASVAIQQTERVYLEQVLEGYTEGKTDRQQTVRQAAEIIERFARRGQTERRLSEWITADPSISQPKKVHQSEKARSTQLLQWMELAAHSLQPSQHPTFPAAKAMESHPVEEEAIRQRTDATPMEHLSATEDRVAQPSQAVINQAVQSQSPQPQGGRSQDMSQPQVWTTQTLMSLQHQTSSISSTSPAAKAMESHPVEEEAIRQRADVAPMEHLSRPEDRVAQQSQAVIDQAVQSHSPQPQAGRSQDMSQPQVWTTQTLMSLQHQTSSISSTSPAAKAMESHPVEEEAIRQRADAAPMEHLSAPEERVAQPSQAVINQAVQNQSPQPQAGRSQDMSQPQVWTTQTLMSLQHPTSSTSPAAKAMESHLAEDLILQRTEAAPMEHLTAPEERVAQPSQKVVNQAVQSQGPQSQVGRLQDMSQPQVWTTQTLLSLQHNSPSSSPEAKAMESHSAEEATQQRTEMASMEHLTMPPAMSPSSTQVMSQVTTPKPAMIQAHMFPQMQQPPEVPQAASMRRSSPRLQQRTMHHPQSYVMEAAPIIYAEEPKQAADPGEHQVIRKQIREITEHIEEVKKTVAIERQVLTEQQKESVRQVIRSTPSLLTEGEIAVLMKQKVETEISRKMDESMQQMTNRVYRRIEEKLKTERERRGRI